MQASKNIIVKDFLVSGETYELIHDPELDLLKTHPQPSKDVLGKYYESQNYISHSDDSRGIMDTIYFIVKKWSLQKKINLIFKQNGGEGSILDVGAGTGEFLKVAMSKGWKVQGVEPNEIARNLATEKGICIKESLSSFKDAKYDVITLWHVLEHIPNLQETIKQLSSLVKTGGTLIIAVPNFKSHDANYYKEFWAAYDVPRHLWHFSQNAVKKLFSENFTLIDTKPMIFDSFYVSLLSEKYKSDKKFSLTAFWVGLVSNIKGWRTNEYSSHIYCFRRK